jgi:hypothetical protein
VSIDGDDTDKIFDTDLSDPMVTYIQWRLPGLGLRVAVTLSPSLAADLMECQSQYLREERNGKQRMKQSL